MLWPMVLHMPGRHNVLNALAAYCGGGVEWGGAVASAVSGAGADAAGGEARELVEWGGARDRERHL